MVELSRVEGLAACSTLARFRQFLELPKVQKYFQGAPEPQKFKNIHHAPAGFRKTSANFGGFAVTIAMVKTITPVSLTFS